MVSLQSTKKEHCSHSYTTLKRSTDRVLWPIWPAFSSLAPSLSSSCVSAPVRLVDNAECCLMTFGRPRYLWSPDHQPRSCFSRACNYNCTLRRLLWMARRCCSRDTRCCRSAKTRTRGVLQMFISSYMYETFLHGQCVNTGSALYVPCIASTEPWSLYANTRIPPPGSVMRPA